MNRPVCQAYLLAAGLGRRAGGPKAWRDCGGRPLLQRQLEFLRKVLPVSDVAVSIQADWLERCRALEPRAVWVVTDPEAAALASVQALVRMLPLRRKTFLYHVDMRVWEPEVFGLLAQRAAASEEADAWAPLEGGRRGHPVLLSPRLQDGLLVLPARKPLGRLHGHAAGHAVARMKEALDQDLGPVLALYLDGVEY